jgi:hypothetical protein
MSGHKREPVGFQAREGRLNRRIAVAGIIATVSVGILSAVVTAHSAPVIKFFGGSPAVSTTITPPAPTPSRPTNSSSPTPPTIQLPVGQAFTEGSFTISNSGIDLDRNPIESGNVSTGTPEIIAEYPTGLYFYGAQDTAQWQQPGVPTQQECHNAELSDGVEYLNYNLTSVQQSRQQARFCILTSEGRDAYVVIPGSTVTSSSPFPAEAFVWATVIPVS